MNHVTQYNSQVNANYTESLYSVTYGPDPENLAYKLGQILEGPLHKVAHVVKAVFSPMVDAVVYSAHTFSRFFPSLPMAEARGMKMPEVKDVSKKIDNWVKELDYISNKEDPYIKMYHSALYQLHNLRAIRARLENELSLFSPVFNQALTLDIELGQPLRLYQDLAMSVLSPSYSRIIIATQEVNLPVVNLDPQLDEVESFYESTGSLLRAAIKWKIIPNLQGRKVNAIVEADHNFEKLKNDVELGFTSLDKVIKEYIKSIFSMLPMEAHQIYLKHKEIIKSLDGYRISIKKTTNNYVSRWIVSHPAERGPDSFFEFEIQDKSGLI